MEALRDRELFKTYRLLQFGDDRIVAKGWFKEVETSAFGAPNSLNPMAIARPDGAFDCIITSHIITKVEDHRVAIRELTRVISPQGLIFLSYPLPGLRTVTNDWGKPDQTKGGNYRILGSDFEAELPALVGNSHVGAVRVFDPVTNDDEIVYIVTKNFAWMRRLLGSVFDFRILE